MFPLGLVAVIDHQLANDGGRGVLIGCYDFTAYSAQIRAAAAADAFYFSFVWVVVFVVSVTPSGN
jgi:hypothetical protein